MRSAWASFGRRAVVVVATLGILVVATSSAALAHTSLIASSPESGQRVAYPPDEVVLTFATEVDPAAVTATLRTATGETIDIEPVTSGPATAVVAFALPRLGHDVYGLEWQSVGDDGHRVLGEVLFGVGTEVGDTTSIGAGGSPLAKALDSAALVLRIGWYLALAALAGLAVVASSGSTVGRDTFARWAPRVIVAAAATAAARAAVALAILLEAGVGSWTARGVAGFGATAAVVAVLWALRDRVGGPQRAVLLALAASLIGGTVAGHAVTRPDPVLAVTFGVVHLAAAAAWVGPLLILLLATRTDGWAALGTDERRAELRTIMGRIAPVAGWSLGAVVVTGGLLALRAWSGLEGAVALTLIVKGVVVAAVALPLGAWHHRTREGWDTVPRTVRVEVIGLVAAVALGGVLVGWDPGWTGQVGALDPAVAAVLDGTADDPAACAELEVGKGACYRSTLSVVLATQGPQAAIDAVVAAQAVDPYVATNCHQVVHDVGNDASEQIEDMSVALSVDGSACWSGYFHGFIEARLATVDDEELLERLPTFCDGAADPAYSFTHYNCLHGLGHGLMLRVDADLFEALPLCRAMEEHWLLRSCASGAFMENVMAAQQGLDVPGVADEDLAHPCNAVEDDMAEDCWMMQTSLIVWRLGGDLPGAFSWCDAVEGPHRATCYKSMGRDISSISALDAQGVIDRCTLGAAEMVQWCIHGAASNAVYETAARDAADALCAASLPEWQDACTTSRDQALSTIALG